MIIQLLFRILLLFLPVASYDFQADFVKLTRGTWCEKQCYFNHSEITLETLQFWPQNCDEHCTIIVLNSNLDVSYSQLKSNFENIKVLHGGIRVENSQFKNLSFFPKNQINGQFAGVTITNNSDLENIDGVIDMFMWNQCPFRLSDNPKLNATSFCEDDYYRDRTDLEVFGNLVDCGCKGGIVTSKNILKLKGCQYISGNLSITSLDDHSDLSALSRVTRITGDVEIKKTNLTSLSFFSDLQEIKSRSVRDDRPWMIVNIHDNPQLQRLGWRALSNLTNLVYDRFTVNLKNLHPEFCLTYPEMLTFVDFDVRFKNLEGHYCQEPEQSGWPKLCVFEKLSSLEEDCVHVFGDLLIDSRDEEHVEKLRTVTHVFGTVTIQNSDLKSVKFLKNLRKIASLNGKGCTYAPMRNISRWSAVTLFTESLPIMRILSNKELKNLVFPSLEKFVAPKGNNRVIVEGNNEKVFETVKECMKLQAQALTTISFNGQPCKSIGKLLPDGEGVDFEDIDYGEFSEVNWDYYDGVLHAFNRSSLDGIFAFLDGMNDVTAVTGIFINIIHLIILLQRELRSSFIYILMIGVSISDTFMAFSFVFDYLLDEQWIYTKNKCNERSYFHAFMNVLDEYIQMTSRRCSSYLALFMAMTRTFSVMYPMNSTLVRLSRPTSAVFMCFIVFLICAVWDGLLYSRAGIDEFQDGYACWQQLNYTSYIGYFVNPPDAFTDVFGAYSVIDGITSLITGLAYLTVTILLLNQLRIAQNRRKSLRTEKSESTSTLVTLMAVTFFVSEALYGVYYIVDHYLLVYFDEISSLASNAQVVLWTLLIINSNAHCFICFFMSTQYRDTAKRMFCKKEEQSTSMLNLGSVSVVRTTKGSTTERTY